ncbi:MAG: hypothetical protein IT246_02245 [Bacteroidia bacterium]|nr:hypothetical protein [Bacteroidia bacterium]
MKTRTKELDVDFIGGQGPLTKEEEKQISEYLKNQKLLRSKKFRQSAKILSKKYKVTKLQY